MNKLIVISGLPGSGKTRFARTLEDENTIRLSSDDLRVELFGFRDQTRNQELWSELFNRAEYYGKQGYDVIVDALNLSVKDRRKLLVRLSRFFDKKTLIQVITPLKELYRINKQREGTEEFIPWDVIRRKVTSFEFPMLNEEFDEVYFKFRNGENEPWDFCDYIHFDQDSPYHNETLGNHTKSVCEYEDIKDRQLYVAARYHDCGKVYTKTYNEEKGHSQFIGHQNVSAYWYLSDILYPIEDALVRYDALGRSVVWNLYLIKYHDLPFNKDRAQLVEYFTKLEVPFVDKFVDDLLYLHEADQVRGVC